MEPTMVGSGETIVPLEKLERMMGGKRIHKFMRPFIEPRWITKRKWWQLWRPKYYVRKEHVKHLFQ